MSGTAVQGRTSDLFSPVGLEKFLESAAQKVFENKLETLATPTNALTLQSKNQKIQTTPMRADNVQLKAERATAQTQGNYQTSTYCQLFWQ